MNYAEAFRRGAEGGKKSSPFTQALVLSLVVFFLIKWLTGWLLVDSWELSASTMNAVNPLRYAIVLGISGYIGYISWMGGRISAKQAAFKAVDGALSVTGVTVTNAIIKIPTLDRRVPLINITNPFRGILVLGGAGAGKSKSFFEPIITQTLSNGYTGFLYDFKFPELTRVALGTAGAPQMYVVNFDDMTRTHRVNPLHPSLLTNQAYADEMAQVILLNLDPNFIKSRDFFVSSAQAYLKGIIWFLREEHPQLCDLPHVVAMANEPAEKVINLLKTNEETAIIIGSLANAVEQGAAKQLAAVVSTLQVNLQKIATKEMFWVLSGDGSVSLKLNDPENPGFLALGSNPEAQKAYSPALALIASTVIKQLNKPGRLESVVILDEGPTLYIPKLEDLPATARSNKVATVFGAQDISQIERDYGKESTRALLANLGYQFFGRVASNDTTRYLQGLFGKEEVQRNSQSKNRNSQDGLNGNSSSGTTESTSWVERDRIQTRELQELRPGEFFGLMVEADVNSFKAQTSPEPSPWAEIPAFAGDVTSDDLKANFRRILAETKALLDMQKPDTGAAPTITPKKPITPKHI